MRYASKGLRRTSTRFLLRCRGEILSRGDDFEHLIMERVVQASEWSYSCGHVRHRRGRPIGATGKLLDQVRRCIYYFWDRVLAGFVHMVILL